VTKKISDSTVRRLSHYLRSLEGFEEPGGTVSSEELAARGQTTAAQVRKDLSHFGSFGKRGLGYQVDELRTRLRRILGIDRTWRVALVGAGRIGLALFEYPAFRARGFECVAIFDSDPDKVGTERSGLVVRDPAEFEAAVQELGIEIVILAVPAKAAQEVASRAVDAGVRGILNFAPIRLNVPPRVPVEEVNLVMELEALSFALSQNERDA
jgi:redox-sensing transcriptional repressor